MPYSIVILITKKPGMGLRDFKDYQENIYMPVMKSLCGPLFPLAHIRRYIAHEGFDENRKRGPMGLPSLLVGRDEDIGWDCLSELTFQDELHFQQFYALMNEPDIADEILEHESKFSDRSKLRFIIMESHTMENAHVTRRD